MDVHGICAGFVKDLHKFGRICVLGWVFYLGVSVKSNGIGFPPLTLL